MTRNSVLILIKSLGLGGAERLLVDSLPYLDRERFDYRFAYLVPWKDTLVAPIVEAGFPVECLGNLRGAVPGRNAPERKGFSPARPLSAALLLPYGFYALAHLHQRYGFDLIHADLPLAGLLARAVGRRYGVPVLYTEHNLQERYRPLTRWANRLTYGLNVRTLAVSDEVAASLERHGMAAKTQVVTLANGVPVEQVQAEAADLDDLRRELAIGLDQLVVGSVAVFRPQKRLVDWVEVAARVAKRRDDVLFLLVGDGPEMAQVRARIQALGLEARFRLPGFREDGRRLMGLIDVYLMTSAHEGQPIAMLEAMALGKPVVATGVGGIPEAVTAGEEGFLAAAGDVDGLAEHVLCLLAAPDQRRAMGQRGVQRVEEEFHLKYRVRAIESMYADILAGGR